MKKVLASLVVCSSLLAAVASAAEHEVKMLNRGEDGIMVFEPAVVKASPGDTIRFVPTDASHNSASAYVPDGAKTWTGKMSQEVSVTLSTEGVYLYQCDPHKVLGMVGVIQVGEPVNMKEARKQAEQLSAAMAQNSERYASYLDQL